MVLRLLFLLSLWTGFSLVGATGTGSVPADGGEVNSVLAAVNGEPITLADVLPLTREKEYQAYAVFSGERLADAVRKIRREAVDELIDRRLIVADCRKKELKLPAGEVEAGLDRIAERMGCRGRREFLRKLREGKHSIDRVRRDVEENLTVQLMMIREFQIGDEPTPKELYDYFERNRAEFASPEQVELSMLKLDPSAESFAEKSAEIGAALKRKEVRFGELVGRFSSGPERDKGGNLGMIECRMLRPEFAAAMTPLKSGAVYGPVKTADGVYWLKIEKYIPRKEADFKEQAKAIRDRLEKVRRETLREAYVAGLRREAVIRYFFGKDD